MYIDGLQVITSKTNYISFSLKIDFVLANKADLDEFPPFTVSHLGLYCLTIINFGESTKELNASSWLRCLMLVWIF